MGEVPLYRGSAREGATKSARKGVGKGVRFVFRAFVESKKLAPTVFGEVS